MKIEGLTAEDVFMLNELWSLDSEEDVLIYLSNLPNEKMKQAETLIELIKLELIDLAINKVGFPDAIEQLERFRK